MKEGIVILIAEDDAGHFVLVKKNLWRCCVPNEIVHFMDGQEVLDFLFGNGKGPHAEKDKAYLLLLDIRMPKVDGMEVIRQIKNHPVMKKVPVIMLTTTDDPEEIKDCYEAGCSFYIVKPSNYNDFMSCVEQLGAFLSLPSVKVPKIDSTERSEDALGVNV